jgi:AcrR family transcriptional regulator
MTAVDGRVIRGERNREAIADALLACYEDGILNPSIPEVAARAGVSARSVHNHFDDAEALRAEVARRQWERHAHFGEPVPKERLVDQRAALYERITPVRRAALLTMHESPTINAYLARVDKMLRRQIEDLYPDATPDQISALDLILSWDAWNRLRVAQGCSVTRAKRIITESIRSLTEGSAS